LKTLTAAHLIRGALEKGKRPIFICPAINLVNQTLEAFEGEGIRDLGVMQAQHERTDYEARVQIASVQTL
jgi:superfamily II DNA or RNA helicase